MNNINLTIAVSAMKGRIPMDESLENRLKYAMKYVREHKSDIFFMTVADDDLMLRAAIAAVMVTGSEEEQDLITRSLAPLKALAAATQGIPVNFGAIDFSDDLIPIMKIWNDGNIQTTN